VSDASPTSSSPKKGRYCLRTFGTLSLTDSQNRTHLGKDGHHHRRLALLAMLAAAGTEGRSRDQLLLFFWPDSTQERARHSLEQLLYAIRRSMDQQAFLGSNPVRLNPEVVSSDVAEFRAALSRGDIDNAVAQYRGPFLGGFYLADAPEFEEWVESERASLQRLYWGALEQLAGAAEKRKDHADAVRWWRMLADADPLSSKTAASMMRALIDAGDHAAALQFAEKYETTVRRELATGVGPQIAEMVSELRAVTSKNPMPRPKLPSVATTPMAPAAQEVASPVEGVQLSEPARRRSGVAFALASIGILVLIAAGGWLGTHLRAGTNVAASPSIAVLPFANVSGNRQDAGFVDGLTEEMISELAQVRNLRVIGRTSAIGFANSAIGARRIADSLGVANLLEGSVEKSGDQLRVQVRLVDGHDGSTRWSQTYDRPFKDVFAVQSDIATTVARELDLRLTQSNLARIDKPSTRNIAAYEMFLRGNDQTLQRSDSGVRAALKYFDNAVALDSTYADAYAGIARMQMRIRFGQDTEMSARARLALGEQAALKAVALDDSSGDAHAALGLVRRNNYQLTSAAAELKRAVALDPTNARYHQWLVQIYALTGRPADALAEASRALHLDTLSAVSNGEYARALLVNDRCDEALQRIKLLESLRPPLLRGGNIAAQCYARRQMWPQAIGEMRRIASNGGPPSQALLGYLLARSGNTGEAKQILASLLAGSTHGSARAFEIATVYAGLGDKDRAFKYLNESIDDRSLNSEYFRTVIAPLQGDPRLTEFMRRFNAQNR
jgi:TolB-like protein/DNA-binding SARP family transcriptional activator